MSFTSELTIAPNAPPIMTPTARSTTLPRRTNALKSLAKLIDFPLLLSQFPLRLGFTAVRTRQYQKPAKPGKSQRLEKWTQAFDGGAEYPTPMKIIRFAVLFPLMFSTLTLTAATSESSI